MFAHALAVRGVHLPPDGDDHVANHTNDVVYRAVLVAETFEAKVRSRGCLAGDWRGGYATQTEESWRRRWGSWWGSSPDVLDDRIGNRERIETVLTLSSETNDPRSASRIHRVDDTLRRRVCAAQSVGSTVFETRGEGVQDTEDTEDVAEKREEVGKTFGAE